MTYRRSITIKEAAYDVMPEAYLKASANNGYAGGGLAIAWEGVEADGRIQCWRGRLSVDAGRNGRARARRRCRQRAGHGPKIVGPRPDDRLRGDGGEPRRRGIHGGRPLGVGMAHRVLVTRIEDDGG